MHLFIRSIRVVSEGVTVSMATERQVDPAPQPESEAGSPNIVLGKVQPYEGYLMRRTRFLKKWLHQWIEIVPGEKFSKK